MSRKIILGFISFCLLFATISVLTTEVDAQKRKKTPKKARKLKKAGDRSFKNRKYQQAVGKYAEAIVIAGEYPAAHFWKGYSHYNLYKMKKEGEEIFLIEYEDSTKSKKKD